MQIAMISYWSCPLTTLGIGTAGGMNVYVLNLAQALGELGHTVDIFTLSHRGEDSVDTSLHANVQVIHLEKTAAEPYDGIDAFVDQIEVLAGERGTSYDVMHAHYYYSGLAGLRLRERLQTPLVVTFHTLGTMKQHYLGIEDQRRIRSESEIIDHADGIIASTELEAADVATWHQVPAEKLFTAHPGVDHHIFRPIDRVAAREHLDLPQDAKIILFAGRIDPIKGIHVLVDAFAQIVNTRTPHLCTSRLLVIGGDPDDEEFWTNGESARLLQQIDAQEIEHRVTFVGSQPHARLAFYYAAADLVAMPSAYETFGFVALEAMACGACVVASRVGGLQYLIQDGINGRLFEPQDVDELSTIMEELLCDREQRERLGRNAAQASYRYCWSTQAEKVVAVYRSIMPDAA
jgi:D-inositol-3-phosphate glycosyltransferase